MLRCDGFALSGFDGFVMRYLWYYCVIVVFDFRLGTCWGALALSGVDSLLCFCLRGISRGWGWVLSVILDFGFCVVGIVVWW